MAGAIRVLIVDDEQVIREGCERALASSGYEVSKAENGARGIELLENERFDIILLDLMMPGVDGFEVLKWVKEFRPSVQVIVITGFATVSEAVKAMRQGAFDFVGKPFSPDYIRIVVARAAENILLPAERERLRVEKALDLETIAEEHSRLTTVIGCMVEAVLVTNHECRVVHCNPAAIRMLELQSDPVVGKTLAASVRDADVNAMVEEVIREGRVVTREFSPGTASRLYLRAHSAPVHTPTGKVLGSVTTFEDITVQKQVDRMKSDFVAMVAHELRSPLASIEQMIYASLAVCDNQAPECKHMHDRMTARTRDLYQLIENLLALSKLESGKVQFTFEALRGDEILSQVVEMVRPQAEKKSIGITMTESTGEWRMSADRDYIHSALSNIVGNAVKYTPDGGNVTISTVLEPGLVRIRISDTGYGISREDLPFIFDRFFRAKTRETRAVTGSGLGLSLVKRVVEAHRGYIQVESEPGKGTAFTLGFPLA